MLKLYELCPELDCEVSKMILDKEFGELTIKFENGVPVMTEKKKKRLYNRDVVKK